MAFQNRQAYGEIFHLPTQYIDNIANKVWQEQKIREQQKLQQDKALDDEFAKNVAGVKSSDIPEITKAYSDFKNAHINLQKKGQKATPQDQMDVMIKKAAAFQAINASKEDKARLAQYGNMVKSDTKGIYDPNAHNMINTWLNTPTSQRKLDEDSNLQYKYAMPNIDKEIKFAATPPPNDAIKEIIVGVDPNDPLKDKVEVYSKMNHPNSFYNNLFTGLAARSDNKGFVRATMDKYTDEEKNDLRTEYEAKIADPKFQAIYGEVKPFPESAANTELGQAVALKTMEAVVNLPIEKVKDKSVLNADRAATRKRAEGMADKKSMANYNDGLIRGRMKLAQSYKMAMKDYTAGVDAAQDEKVLNTFLKNTIDNGSNGSATLSGVKYDGTITDLPKDISKKYVATVTDPNDSKYTIEKEPDRWLFTSDGKNVIPLYYEKDANKQGKGALISNPNQKPISIQNIKTDLAKLLLGQKQRGGEVVDDNFFEDYQPATNSSTKSVKKTTTTNKWEKYKVN